MRRWSITAFVSIFIVAVTQVAGATDLPVKTLASKAPAAVATESGYYFWLDGMYDKAILPKYDLGFHLGANAAPFTDQGSVSLFDPHLDGGGVRGGFGYKMPGTSLRFELGGSYVEAKNSLSQSTVITNNALVAPLLVGGPNNGAVCFAGVSCTVASNLSTDYSTWQLNGKFAKDWKYGSFTLTPSLAVFGGNTRVDQTLSQAVAIPVNFTGGYTASTTEQWWDIGARVGLDVNAAVTNALTLGIGGWVGGAYRHTSLSGNDVGTDNAAPVIFDGASTLSTSDSRGVLLANAEARFVYQFNQMLALRGFVGLNYDGSVPGIAGPTWTGTIVAPTSRTAASIYYAHETSYYAGGGVIGTW
jgi:hypothetical protein